MSADWAQLNDDDPAIFVVSESSGTDMDILLKQSHQATSYTSP